MKCVGLDLSLTSTGVAVATQDGAVTDRIISAGHKDATLDDRADRIATIAGAVAEHCTGADLVVIEGPSFGQARQGGQHDRAGLWWAVVLYLSGNKPVVEVPPATRSRYATGKGNAAKDDVLSAVIRRYPHVDVNGNDEGDALILAAMGARHLGFPLEVDVSSRTSSFIPQANLAAMDAVRWPQHLGGAA